MNKLPEWFNVGWAIAVVVVGLAFFLGGRLESSVQKQSRVNAALVPVKQQLNSCDEKLTETRVEFKHHRQLTGHPQMEIRMKMVEASLATIQTDIKTILQKLN